MKDILDAFDHFLGEKGLSFQSTVIGGAALIVMGTIERATDDVDCLDPPIPDEIRQAALEFRNAMSKKGILLKENWLNNGPASLIRDLPKTWEKETIPLYRGKFLNLKTLGRLDLLRSKLFAYCDRQQDFQDCLAMKPTAAELKSVYPWVAYQDGNPLWPVHVKKSLEALGKELGYDIEL